MPTSDFLGRLGTWIPPWRRVGGRRQVGAESDCCPLEILDRVRYVLFYYSPVIAEAALLLYISEKRVGGGRVDEGARLKTGCTLIGYHGFESRPPRDGVGVSYPGSGPHLSGYFIPSKENYQESFQQAPGFTRIAHNAFSRMGWYHKRTPFLRVSAGSCKIIAATMSIATRNDNIFCSGGVVSGRPRFSPTILV